MRGIPFKPDMLRQILTCFQCGEISYTVPCACGSEHFYKTMTRRIIKSQPHEIVGDMLDASRWYACDKDDFAGNPDREMRCPYGQKDEKLYIKEALVRSADGIVLYAFDNRPVLYPGTDLEFPWNWKPSRLGAMYMPRWAARFFIENLGSRPERLHKIKNRVFEIEMEGVRLPRGGYCEEYTDAFINLWDSINAKRCFGWDADPWVWAIPFKRIQEAAHE